ncbi:MAG TPA: AAA family ATPase, partial [Phycisphaerales bacterium]|nr:AAA family ATPase [Phycisphaerales bacterium]
MGKTTAMYQTVERLIEEGTEPKRLAWLMLNQPYLMEYPLDWWVKQLIELNKADSKRPLYLFLDEVNYADQWDLWLKTFYDEKLPVRIVATSSSTAALRDRQFESGVGRWEDQYLSPCLFGEYLELSGAVAPKSEGASLEEALLTIATGGFENAGLSENLRRFLLIGGYPELVIQPPGPDEVSEVLRSQHVLRTDAIQR